MILGSLFDTFYRLGFQSSFFGEISSPFESDNLWLSNLKIFSSFSRYLIFIYSLILFQVDNFKIITAIMFKIFWDSFASWANFPFTTSEAKRDE